MAKAASRDTDVYIIDTCAMVHMRDLADQETAWSIIRSLIAGRRLVMCREAWNELKNVDKAIYKALQDVKDTLVLPLTGADMLPKVGVIQHKYRQLCRPRIRRHIADGYIVAYAKERRYVVVTDEQEKRQKMPVVCRKEGIPCIDLPTLLELEADLAA